MNKLDKLFDITIYLTIFLFILIAIIQSVTNVVQSFYEGYPLTQIGFYVVGAMALSLFLYYMKAWAGK